MHEAYQDDGASYFHGDMKALRLDKSAVEVSRIQEIAASGIPEPDTPPTVEVTGDQNPELVIWENGNYSMTHNNGQTSSLKVSEITKPVDVKGSWQVSFPSDLGAPAHITLDKLISLKDHPNDGVKYFSGKTTYKKSVTIQSDVFSSGKRLILDLGWVEVFAKVRLNGKDVGTVWKAHCRIDKTEAAKPGNNDLEIMVTNLWPNRLIGDEHLPSEAEYKGGNSILAGAIEKLPEWYTQGKPKPGKRRTFATWKHFDKNDPLLESGLLGPVKLRTAVVKKIMST